MRRIANRMIEGLVVATALALCAAPSARAEGCTRTTVRGNYGGLLTGTVIGVGPIALVATVTFDGIGGWFYDESGSINGNPIPTQHFSGTYTVTSNCAGSTKDSGGNSTDFVILRSGTDIEIMMAGTGPGAVFTVVLKKRAGSDE
jgi:hypothetical protein